MQNVQLVACDDGWGIDSLHVGGNMKIDDSSEAAGVNLILTVHSFGNMLYLLIEALQDLCNPAHSYCEVLGSLVS